MADPNADLLAAIAQRDVTALRAALDAGASTAARDSLGMPALWRAVGQGEGDLVDAMLARGADPDIATDQGNTPLMLAAARGDITMVRRLLDAGANPVARNRWDFSPMDWASWPANAQDMRGVLSQAGA